MADLKAWPHCSDLTIVDGGSRDSTISIAQIQGINIINSLEQNRGLQLGVGASKAKGEWLLFLHADSRLDKVWVKKLLKIMQTKTSKNFAWYFDFKIKKYNLQFRILEFAVALRSHFFTKTVW